MAYSWNANQALKQALKEIREDRKIRDAFWSAHPELKNNRNDPEYWELLESSFNSFKASLRSRGEISAFQERNTKLFGLG